jgi:hypothetical protein
MIEAESLGLVLLLNSKEDLAQHMRAFRSTRGAKPRTHSLAGIMHASASNAMPSLKQAFSCFDKPLYPMRRRETYKATMT